MLLNGDLVRAASSDTERILCQPIANCGLNPVVAPASVAARLRSIGNQRAAGHRRSRLADASLSAAGACPPIRLTNSPRLDSLIRAGNLYLTAQDVVALAIENNIDVEVQRYGPLLAKEVLRRAQGGGALRSVGAAVAAGPQSVSLQGVSVNNSGSVALSVRHRSQFRRRHRHAVGSEHPFARSVPVRAGEFPARQHPAKQHHPDRHRRA